MKSTDRIWQPETNSVRRDAVRLDAVRLSDGRRFCLRELFSDRMKQAYNRSRVLS